MAAPISFVLPDRLNAPAPPERRGLRRDRVRMMVSDRKTGESFHTRFDRLPEILKPGDLLVLNNSRTVPAVLKARWNRGHVPMRREAEIRLARRIDERRWDALVVGGKVRPGDRFRFSWALTAVAETADSSLPLVRLRFSLEGPDLLAEIYALGEPVRYEYVQDMWDLDYYQNVYATEPGSVELPSAGRPFSWEMLFQLKKRGIGFTFLTLHTGLSDWPGVAVQPAPEQNCEYFSIPPETVFAVHRTKQEGGRVIAVGTTVVRALESAVSDDGTITHRNGWTCLRIDASVRLRVVDGLMTGFHEPEASHLDLLSAFAPPHLLERMYLEAVREEYLWHEFGDIHLLL